MANYTTLSEKELHVLLEQYEIGRFQTCEPLDGGQANSSIRIETDRGTFILSICDEKDIDEIESLTQTLLQLEASGIPASRVVQTAEGKNQIAFNTTPVYLKRYIPGKVQRHLSPLLLANLGKTLEKLHQLPIHDHLPDRFPYGLHRFSEVLNSGLNHPYVEWLKKKMNSLEKRINPEMNKRLIHGDVFWDNLVVDGDTLVAILDFEEACHYYTLFDLGMCAVGCCSQDGHFNESGVAALLEGYSTSHPFTRNEVSQLPVFIEYAAVAASFWRFRQYNIIHPRVGKEDTYIDLALLADNLPTISLTKISSNHL